MTSHMKNRRPLSKSISKWQIKHVEDDVLLEYIKASQYGRIINSDVLVEQMSQCTFWVMNL